MSQPNRFRGMKCGLANHSLQGSGVLVTDAQHISFIRKRKKDFRVNDLICQGCFQTLHRIFKLKYKRALELKHFNSLTVSSGTDQSFDSIDRLVYTTRGASTVPNSQSTNNSDDTPLRQHVERSRITSPATTRGAPTVPNSQSTNNSDDIPLRQHVERSRITPPATTRNQSNLHITADNESTDSERPTTSAAAAARRRQRERERPATGALSEARRVADYDDDYFPSPNAVNGTRLPHIQPIPRRRPREQPSDDVMDRYIRTGLLGG